MSDAIDQILDLGFLGAIAREDLLSLRPAPELLSAKTGETVLWQGESGQAYFLLLRGRLRRFVDDERGRRKYVGDVIPGQGVGASGLLTDDGYAATVRVVHDSELVRISRPAFLQLMVLSWEFAIGVSREQIERVRAAAAPEGRHPTIKNIAVVPIDADANPQIFLDALAEAMGPMASVVTVDESVMGSQAGMAQTPPRTLESSSPAKVRLDAVTNILEAFERKYDVVLYQVSSVVDEWTRLIFGRADLVLLVASVGESSRLREIETVLIEPTEEELLPRIDLAILHGRDWTTDCRTRDWLDIRRVDEWHHLRGECQEDFQRLARVLTGNAITLVLGGGGARGLAQIGVFKALRESGIPIDRVAGTSAGALNGALLARGADPDEIAEAMRVWADKGTPGRDYTFPILALVRGKKLHDVTREVVGEAQIEDLSIPFFCLSADLSENKAAVHDRGKLWRAVRASVSVPGVGPPLFDNGRVLTDGGVVNNLPADIAAQRHAGRIVVVDVSLSQKLTVPEDYNDLVPSGWRILWRRINPFLEPLKVPGIFEILSRSAMVGNDDGYRKARELADLSIQPPVSDAGLLDFHDIDRLIEVGYEHTVAQLSSIGAEALRKIFRGVEAIRLDAAPSEERLLPIDRAQFNEILGVDDDEAFEKSFDIFASMFPVEIESLARAVASGESSKIRERAHRAKSAAANMAAPGLTVLLQGIENSAKLGEVDNLEDRVDEVWIEFRRIAAFCFRG